MNLRFWSRQLAHTSTVRDKPDRRLYRFWLSSFIRLELDWLYIGLRFQSYNDSALHMSLTSLQPLSPGMTSEEATHASREGSGLK